MSDIQHIGGRTPDLTEENVDKLVALFPRRAHRSHRPADRQSRKRRLR